MIVRVLKTARFDSWLKHLRDREARARILTRVERLGQGNPGDHAVVGPNVFEMRIDHGPGYRVYYTRRGPLLVLLLVGGDKRTQARDIETAIRLAGGR
jgi:putative addiction module killer protein